jgi:hypothetical protein
MSARIRVQYLTLYRVNVAQPHALVTRLDTALVQLGLVPKLEGTRDPL